MSCAQTKRDSIFSGQCSETILGIDAHCALNFFQVLWQAEANKETP